MFLTDQVTRLHVDPFDHMKGKGETSQEISGENASATCSQEASQLRRERKSSLYSYSHIKNSKEFFNRNAGSESAPAQASQKMREAMSDKATRKEDTKAYTFSNNYQFCDLNDIHFAKKKPNKRNSTEHFSKSRHAQNKAQDHGSATASKVSSIVSESRLSIDKREKDIDVEAIRRTQVAGIEAKSKGCKTIVDVLRAFGIKVGNFDMLRGNEVSDSDIRKAYLMAAMKFHPDRQNKSNVSIEKQVSTNGDLT